MCTLSRARRWSQWACIDFASFRLAFFMWFSVMLRHFSTLTHVRWPCCCRLLLCPCRSHMRVSRLRWEKSCWQSCAIICMNMVTFCASAHAEKKNFYPFYMRYESISHAAMIVWLLIADWSSLNTRVLDCSSGHTIERLILFVSMKWWLLRSFPNNSIIFKRLICSKLNCSPKLEKLCTLVHSGLDGPVGSKWNASKYWKAIKCCWAILFIVSRMSSDHMNIFFDL